MKLATCRNGTRDGALAIVSRDLTKAVIAETTIAGLATLQQLLDDWQDTYLKAERIYAELNEAVEGRRTPPFEMVAFDPQCCMAPLPRAYQWADGSAYVNHVELVRRARGAEMPASFWTDPLMYQGGSDTFLGPRDPIEAAEPTWGIDLEGEVAVVTDDVPMGATPAVASDAIRLVMLVNDVSLRNLIRPNWPRASASSTASRRRRSRRWRSHPTSWAPPGTAASCTCHCWPLSTASRSADRTRDAI